MPRQARPINSNNNNNYKNNSNKKEKKSKQLKREREGQRGQVEGKRKHNISNPLRPFAFATTTPRVKEIKETIEF